MKLLRVYLQKVELGMLVDTKCLCLYQIVQKSTIQTRPEYGSHSVILQTCEKILNDLMDETLLFSPKHK